MSAERPNFEANRDAMPGMATATIVEKVLMEDPASLRMDRVEDAMSVLKGEKEASTPKPPEQPKTKTQEYLKDMLRAGDLSPYQRERPWFDWSAIGSAWNNPQSQGTDSRIMAVDMAMRGGADKPYNQLGGIGKRLERMGVLAVNTVPYFAFDVLTSIPSSIIIRAGMRENSDTKLKRGSWTGLTKLVEVTNDKVVTAWADMNVKKMTGEKAGWVHEGPDKLADTLQTGLPDIYKDMVNGPVLQSLSNAAFQVPIAGALFEQIWTRISLWQEKSQMNKGLAKAVYMATGAAWFVWRESKNTDMHPPRALSTVIADRAVDWWVKRHQ